MEITKILLQNGASIDASRRDWYTPLLYGSMEVTEGLSGS